MLTSVLSDTEARLGLLDLSAGLNFLHTEARLVHLGVCPENVYLSPTGKWKIAGIGLSVHLLNEPTIDVDTTDVVYTARSATFNESAGGPIKVVYNLFYSAPEVICLRKATPNSDLYSLGALIYSIYKVMTSLKYNEAYLLKYDEFSEQGHKNA